jgi:chromosomal replication initiator protein
MTLLEAWQKAQNPIKTSLGTTSYDTWFSHLRVAETTPGVLTILAPDEYFKDWIDEKYRTIIDRCLRTEAGQEIRIEFAVDHQLININTKEKLTSIEKALAPAQKPSDLNPRFLFENLWWAPLTVLLLPRPRP